MAAYNILTVEQFGRAMITTGDLDPIYIALHRMQMPEDQRNRWLVAYWCFYHAGFACYASERDGNDFWQTMMTAAVNEVPAPTGGRWPRGSERRHFRGGQGIRAIQELTALYKRPGYMVEHIASHSLNDLVRPVEGVFRVVKSHRGFGDWISFKVADMLDRCTDYPVQFDNAHVFMFADPVKGAELACLHWGHGVVKGEYFSNLAVKRLIETFSNLTAPPKHERPPNVQEIETVLCKWKGHMRGHHPVGHDTHEILQGLLPWQLHSLTVSAFWDAMPSLHGTQI